ncbi:MAG: matrixin family metalloprotease, partial [Methanomicrobiales archaeon]|nr:matrixin family metalloprotease [Methanomicrobiales archaeon]
AWEDAPDITVDTADACYAFLAEAHPWWKSTTTYVINPTNPQGLSESFIGSAISNSAETWDVATPAELFKDIFSFSGKAQFGKHDGKNVLAFGNFDQSGVIAVTYLWFRSHPFPRIVEYDTLFDTDYYWGDAGTSPVTMDLQSIATHELGHGIGLADVYDSCYAVTMYGYSREGETWKRTLESPDRSGLIALTDDFVR